MKLDTAKKKKKLFMNQLNLNKTIEILILKALGEGTSYIKEIKKKIEKDGKN